MKKKIITLNLVLCLSLLCVCLTGCFSPAVEKLSVQYTPNLQLFVGEDWHDDLIKGTAFYSDDTKKDVTKDLTIDTSHYNKTQVGEYDIIFQYKGIEVEYQVKVVEEMTNGNLITKRIEPCFQKAFKAQNGVLEFSASTLDCVNENTYLKQTIQYKLEDNTLKEHYMIESTNENGMDSTLLCEILYVGDLTNGTLTNKYYTSDDDINFYYDVNSKQGTLAEFESTIQQIATVYGLSSYLGANEWLNVYTDYYPNINPLKLTKLDNTYTITLTNNNIIKIDTDGYVSEWCGIKFQKTTNIPNELTAE